MLSLICRSLGGRLVANWRGSKTIRVNPQTYVEAIPESPKKFHFDQIFTVISFKEGREEEKNKRSNARNVVPGAQQKEKYCI
jgi:hypothetical protein